MCVRITQTVFLFCFCFPQETLGDLLVVAISGPTAHVRAGDPDGALEDQSLGQQVLQAPQTYPVSAAHHSYSIMNLNRNLPTANRPRRRDAQRPLSPVPQSSITDGEMPKGEDAEYEQQSCYVRNDRCRRIQKRRRASPIAQRETTSKATTWRSVRRGCVPPR